MPDQDQPKDTQTTEAQTPPKANAPEPAAEKAKKAAAPPVVTKITVRGPAAGRWRAGRKFGAEAVEIPLADLSDDHLLALQGDPALICTMS